MNFRVPAELVTLTKACSLCKKTGQKFYKSNISWCWPCAKEKARAKSKAYHAKNRKAANTVSITRYRELRVSINARLRQVTQALKAYVFGKYGGAVCACCGENNLIFLTIDHINGGGTKHRREMGGGGRFNYRWIVRNNFPPGFQVLCMNCNFGKGQNFLRNGRNICPHSEAIQAVA